MNIDIRRWVRRPVSVAVEGDTAVVADSGDAVQVAEGIVVAEDNTWRRVARWSLYLVAFFAPLLFLSKTLPPTLIRELFISAFTFIGFISWLGESLVTGKVFYKRSLINAAILAVVVILFLSTMFSPQSLKGLWGADQTGERFFSFVVFGLLFFTAGGVLYSKKESERLLGWLCAGAFVLAIFSLIQFFSPSIIPFSSLARPDVNPIGTVNGLGVFLGLFLVYVIGVLANAKRDELSKYPRIALYLFAVALLANLLIINFRSIWVGLVVGVVVLLGFQFLAAPASQQGSALQKRSGLALLFLMLAVLTFLILVNRPLVTVNGIPAEITPSYKATFDVARQALKNDVLLGSGPGTFGLAYSLYRDLSINQTNFWGVRFNNGIAFMPTALGTTGIIGALAFLALAIIAVASFVRYVTRFKVEDPLIIAGAAAIVYGFFMWWVYMSSFATNAVLFLLAGVLIARMNEVSPEGEPRSLWRISERAVSFTAPWTTFAVSLGIIFLMVGGVTMMYYSVQQYLGAVAYAKAVEAYSADQNADAALEALNRAISNHSSNDQYYRAATQMLMQKVQAILNSPADAANREAILNNLQVTVTNTINTATRATQLNPADSLNWSQLGAVYQLIVPVFQGSEQFAAQAYDKALQLDPSNPSLEFHKASAYVALADRIAVLLSQGGQTGDSRTNMEKARADALENARKALEHSLKLKPDYSQSNYLLAQVLLKQGNTSRAIEQVEAVKKIAPFDIGVAFQLGVLYYQSAQYAKAEAEFVRAVAMNENYSNARYFLGLLYDRAGEKDKAIAEFERIAALNPDNAEVPVILRNLKAGKPALATISPPAPAPSERREPPVKDSGMPGR